MWSLTKITTEFIVHFQPGEEMETARRGRRWEDSFTDYFPRWGNSLEGIIHVTEE
jgi:hypothetical protein